MASAASGVPMPPNFRKVERAIVVANYGNSDLLNKAAYARIESNMATAQRALDALPIEERRAAVLKYGAPSQPNAAIGLTRDGVSARTFAAGQIVGYGGATAIGGGGVPGGDARMLRSIVDRQIRQNIYQLGHPGCGPGGSHPSDCNQAPIFQPIAIPIR